MSKGIFEVSASGVIVARDGTLYFALTCYHVTYAFGEDISEVNIEVGHPLLSEREPALIYRAKEESELSLIVFNSDIELPVIEIADEIPELLSDVYLHGYPESWTPYVSKGIFSSKQSMWEDILPCAWVVTAQVWHGCSGGGVYTEEGKLFGIATVLRVSVRYFDRLPWLCGIVPLPKVREFLIEEGFLPEPEEIKIEKVNSYQGCYSNQYLHK